MNKIYYLFLVCAFTAVSAFGQSAKYSKKADSLYYAKAYAEAGRSYLAVANTYEFIAATRNDLYNAACCYALSNKPDSAMLLLAKAIKSGYEDTAHLAHDSDLNSLHQRQDWKKLLSGMHPRTKSTSNPNQARLITTDINNFWKAYDRAQKDTAHRAAIYKKYYIDEGTPGLQDYFAYKVRTYKNFAYVHDTKPKFYAAIRKNTRAVEVQKPQMIASFVKLKHYYQKAVFPDVYFVIGAFTSGGTSSDNGLLIGLDQSVRTPDIPTDELSLWQRNNFNNLSDLPHLIAHELIHFNQNGMAGDTTLLRAVLVEGMADFLGELISGKTANERLHIWARGREKQIWSDFQKEMYLNRADNWIANSGQETPDKPADLGYWVGYQICKAYYDRAADKEKAVADMLNIKNYKTFYTASGAETLFR